jgi:lipopolysaccharide transport system ATP-binding protein
MSDIAIKIENVSKQYRLGVIGTGTLSHDMKRWWTVNIRGQEDPYLKIGETNDRSSKGLSDYVWALKDINLEIKQGDIVGIIGKNGAGKSTLLKILSRVTKPTTGSIRYKGRIASLLEVGTGFHPEMTGRENIYMNGAIMGMTRNIITRRFDEIVAFSGVERYIDTPVKRYSSGMTVRLGFSIAAHLEPDILVVDEVLAVGDAEFQRKAIGKMQDVSQAGERTVLFVSHNMAAVKSLCNRGVILSKGQIQFIGKTEDAISKYLETSEGEISTCREWNNELTAPGNDNIKMLQISVAPNSGDYIDTTSGFKFTVKIKNYRVNTRIGFNLRLLTHNEIVVFTTGFLMADRDSKEGIYAIDIDVPPYLLNQGIYKTEIWFGEYGTLICKFSDELFYFEVLPKITTIGENPLVFPGVTKPDLKCQINFEN